MMKIRFIIGSLLLMFSALPSTGQNTFYINKKVDDMLDTLTHLQRLITHEFDYEGSPYYNEEFLRGDLYYGENWKYPDVMFRYNIFNDEMEFLVEDRVYALAPDNRIQRIIIEDDVFVVAECHEGNRVISGFFRALYEGKVDLLSKLHMTFREKQPDFRYIEPDPAKFTRMNDQFYLRKDNGDLCRISSLNKMIEFIDDFKAELQRFASEEKISKTNKDDLIKFLSYYQTLVDDGGPEAGM
jgi:hypothetical protein